MISLKISFRREKTCENLLFKCVSQYFRHSKKGQDHFRRKEDDPVKKHFVSKVFVSVAPEGRIKAKAYRGHSRVELLLFDTVQDLLEWPEISVETPVEFRGKGLVPNLKLPCEPIFLFCSPEEIKEFSKGFVIYDKAIF